MSDVPPVTCSARPGCWPKEWRETFYARVDWSVHDQYPPNTVWCACGAVYRSHTKMMRHGVDMMYIVTRVPCPGCGERVDNSKRVSSDPEAFVIKAP